MPEGDADRWRLSLQSLSCWSAQASMNREKFPEKVPFRLTRMMTKAMEVSGIEGNFR